MVELERSSSSASISNEQIKEDLRHMMNKAVSIEARMRELSGKVTPDATKESLDESRTECRDLIKMIRDLEVSVQSTCKDVENVSKDKSMSLDSRKELRTEALKVLEYYANVMEDLKKLRERLNTIYHEKEMGIFGVLKGKVNGIDDWLTDNIHKYEHFTIKYNTYMQLKQVSTQIKELTKSIAETWKRYQGIAAEWNSELCDEVNDEKYADYLDGVTAKFKILNDIANKLKTLVQKMLVQRKAEEVEVIANLKSWSLYADVKERDLRDAMADPWKHDAQIEAHIKDINEKDTPVAKFIEEAVKILQKNKFDAIEVKRLEGLLNEFIDQWKRLKVRITRVTTIKKNFATWKIKLTEMNGWLTVTTTTYYKFVIKYGTYLHLKEVNAQIKELIKTIAENWKKFEVIADEWNNELSQEVDNDEYADVLDKAKEKFVTLNGIANELKKLAYNMLQQRKAEDAFEAKLSSWKDYADSKEAGLRSGFRDPENCELQIKTLMKEIDDNDDAVRDFINESSGILINKQFNAEEVAGLKEELIKFEHQWENLKVVISEGQKEVVDHLTVSLSKWELILNDFITKLDDCDIDRDATIQMIISVVKTLQALISEIEDQDEDVKQYEAKSQILLTLIQYDHNANLSIKLQQFIKRWNALNRRTRSMLTGLLAHHDEVIKNEETLMSEWKTKSASTEDRLNNLDTDIGSFEESVDDSDDHLEKLDELEVKVNADIQFADDTILYGKTLTQGSKFIYDENKETIEKEVGSLSAHKESTYEKFLALMRLYQERRFIRRSKEEILASLAKWRQKITENNKEIDRCENTEISDTSETQNSINTLTTLIEGMDADDNDLREFGASVNAYKANSTFSVDILELFNDWGQCKQKARACLAMLKLKVTQIQKYETAIMNEWNKDILKIVTRRDGHLNELSGLCSKHLHTDQLVDLATYITEWSKWNITMNDIEVSILKKMEVGNELITNKDVQLVDHVKKIQDDIALLNEKQEHSVVCEDEAEKQKIEAVAKLIPWFFNEWSDIHDEYKIKLDELNGKKESSDIQVVADSIKEVETMVIDIGDQYAWDELRKKFVVLNSIKNLNEFKKTFQQITESLTDEDDRPIVDNMNDQLQRLLKKWDELNMKIGSTHTELKDRYDKLTEEERKLMEEWKVKQTVTEDHLNTMRAEIKIFDSPDTEFDDNDDYLEQLNELEKKVDNSVRVADESVEVSVGLSEGDRLVVDENRTLVKNDGDDLRIKRASLMEAFSTIKKRTIETRELRRMLKINEEGFYKSLTNWQEKLQANTDIIEKCEVSESSGVLETQKSIDTLVKLIEEIVSEQDDLEKFEVSAHEVMKKHPGEKANFLKMDLQLFLKSWAHHKEKATARLAILNLKINQMQKYEFYVMNEWDRRANEILKGLGNIDNELTLFYESSVQDCPENLTKMITLVSKYENLARQITDISDTIDKQSAIGRDLVESNKVQLSENVSKIESDIVTFNEKLSPISKTIAKSKSMIIEGHVISAILKELNEWTELYGVYSSKLGADSLNVDNAMSSDIRTLISVIKERETIHNDIDSHSNDIKEFDNNSTVLIKVLPDGQHIQSQLQTFFENWDQLEDGSNHVIILLRSEHDRLLADEERLMRDWKTKHIVTEEWLDNVVCEVEVLHDISDEDIETYLDKLDEVEHKVNTETIVDDSIEHGRLLSESHQVVNEFNRASIKSVVDAFHKKKIGVHESIMMVRRRLAQLREQRGMEMNQDEHLRHFTKWQKKLRHNNQAVDKCDVDVDVDDIDNIPDTQDYIDTLALLLDEMATDEEELKRFELATREYMKTIYGEKATYLKMDLQLFLEKWAHCKERATARLAILRLKISQMENHEGYTMNEWNAHVLNIMSRLESVEQELSSLGACPDSVREMLRFIERYEVIPNRIADTADLIGKQKGIGDDLVMSRKVRLPDHVTKIQQDIAAFDEKSSMISMTNLLTKKEMADQTRAIMFKNVEDCRAWLPAVERKSRDNDEQCGDIGTLNKQIVEIRLIHTQASKFIDILTSEQLLKFLTDEERGDVNAASISVSSIIVWIHKRLAFLEKSVIAWNEFETRKIELLNYLRDVEKILYPPVDLDWDKPSTIKAFTDSFLQVKNDMETKRFMMVRLNKLADDLIDSIETEGDRESDSRAICIRSSVSDIMNLWNSRVKQSIELITLLNASRKKYKKVRKESRKVRAWITHVNELLNQYDKDTEGKRYLELREVLDVVQSEEECMKQKIVDINRLEKELSLHFEVTSQYSSEGKVVTQNFIYVELKGLTELNRDLVAVLAELEEFRKLRGRARLLSRRVVGSKNEKVEQLAKAKDEKVEQLVASKNEKVEKFVAVKNEKVEKFVAAKNEKMEKLAQVKNEKVEKFVAAKNVRMERLASTKREKVKSLKAATSLKMEKLAAAKNEKVEKLAAAKDDKLTRLRDSTRRFFKRTDGDVDEVPVNTNEEVVVKTFIRVETPVVKEEGPVTVDEGSIILIDGLVKGEEESVAVVEGTVNVDEQAVTVLDEPVKDVEVTVIVDEGPVVVLKETVTVEEQPVKEKVEVVHEVNVVQEVAVKVEEGPIELEMESVNVEVVSVKVEQ